MEIPGCAGEETRGTTPPATNRVEVGLGRCPLPGRSERGVMSDLTIVIPTQNRAYFLGKVLEYWAQAGCPYVISIGDASAPDQVDLTRATVDRYRDRLRITYERQPPAILSQPSVIALLRGVATPYSVICGDDDFLVPRQLARCVEFLRLHDDYSLACGQVLFVSVEEGADRRWTVTKIDAAPDLARSNEEETPSRRIVRWAYPVRGINSFSVQRTGNMRVNWERAEQLGLCVADRVDAPLYEVCHNVLAAIQGKQVSMPGLYHVMLRHTNKKPGVSAFDRLVGWDWPKQVLGMVSYWAEEVVRSEDIDYQTAHALAKATFVSWLIPYVSRYRDTRLRERGLLGSRALSQRPVREAIGAIPGTRRIIRTVRRAVGRREVSKASLLDPRSPYHADFMPIYRTFMGEETLQ